ALEYLDNNQYTVIISDMVRAEGSNEGYLLLKKVREKNIATPFFIYAGSNSSEHKTETKRRGGQDTTNNPQELFEMVTKSLLKD
ncbi:MAG: hypothetical protein ABI358_13895, partial [Ginsengibacter sp.]